MTVIPSYAFEFPIAVLPGDIDAMGHVNNVVYIRWIQQASEAHWTAKTTPALRETMGWVVSRHEIDYLRPCFLGDRLMAYTWPERGAGAKMDRYVVIKNLKTGKETMRSKTAWTLLNLCLDTIKFRNLKTDGVSTGTIRSVCPEPRRVIFRMRGLCPRASLLCHGW